MRRCNRFIIILACLFVNTAYAFDFFIDGLDWRPTETNDWVYVNSETLPNQTLTYKTIDFNYTPGFRVGMRYVADWDALLAYTSLDASTRDAATGHLQPSFSGSVTAKPSQAYLYDAGQVKQSIDYNVIDLDFGKMFSP